MQESSPASRREFLKNTAMATVAAGVLAQSTLVANASAPSTTQSQGPDAAAYWLTNVTLETGFTYDANKVVTGTTTKKANILISKGKIDKVSGTAPTDALPKYDMQGALVVPSFSDMHVHIDKANYGGPWKASSPFVSVREKIKEEQRDLPGKLAEATHRAKQLLALMTSQGTTNVRVQVNIDPTMQLQNMEKVLEALNAYREKVSFDLVAFPQHGLLGTGADKFIDKAMKSGCTYVGGVDPATIDGDIERSLNTTMELAVKNNAPIDLHLHNGGTLGTFTLNRLCKLTEEAKWQGKVTVTHAYCLGDVPKYVLEDTLDQLAAARIVICSSVPFGSMPSPEDMARKGIQFQLGTDCINDMWSSFGNGNMLERASLLAERFGWDDEYSLNRALPYITQNLAPLDSKGKQVWPAQGDAADLYICQASCTAEMVARRTPPKAVLKNGKPSVWNMG